MSMDMSRRGENGEAGGMEARERTHQDGTDAAGWSAESRFKGTPLGLLPHPIQLPLP